MSEKLNNALLRLSKRAESVERQKLVETFVDTGALRTLSMGKDHQLIYGRRGTGKTHALLYLAETVQSKGDLAVYVDMRTVGSTGGIYADSSLPLAERATRLIADTLTSVHEALLEAAIHGKGLDLGQVGPALDDFASAISEVVVKGEVEEETKSDATSSSTANQNMGISLDAQGAALRFETGDGSTRSETRETRIQRRGDQIHRVHFGAVGSSLRRITSALVPARLWILIDEWSVVPIDLQPLLADLIRRALLPTPNTTVKLAAIEQRTTIQNKRKQGDYIGIEIGADMAADLNLDDFMVFENDAGRATDFLRELIFKHYKSVEDEAGITDGPTTPQQLIQMVFTQKNVFEELVKAAEGVPRDAIQVLALSAQRAGKEQISISNVRTAAKLWYLRDKEAAVSANPKAKLLLHWIVDNVIGQRQARAFLLRSAERHPLIDGLFDARVMHLLKRSVSGQDQPGIRYDVYKIDYGCYVDLLTTQKAPKGLLLIGADQDKTMYIDVPSDDYRAIRRAILDLSIFEQQFTSVETRS
jgi:hypothetical protein